MNHRTPDASSPNSTVANHDQARRAWSSTLTLRLAPKSCRERQKLGWSDSRFSLSSCQLASGGTLIAVKDHQGGSAFVLASRASGRPCCRKSSSSNDFEQYSDRRSGCSSGSWRIDEVRRSASTWLEPLMRPSAQSEKWLLALFVILSIAFSVAPLANEVFDLLNKDYDLWHQTGRTALAGGILYPRDGRPFPFMYPPSCAAFLALIAVVDKSVMVLGMLVVTTVSWLFCVLASVYLATGRVRSAPPFLYLVPSLAVIPFIHDMFLLGQPVLLLLALMLGAFICLRRHWPAAAGVLIAVAAAIKAYPVLAVGYLVYRRLWKATAAAVVTLAVLLIVIPIPIRGTNLAWTDLATWVRGMVFKYDANTIAQRPERSYSSRIKGSWHSRIACCARFRRMASAKDPWSVGIANMNFQTVNGVIVVAGLGLGVFFLSSLPRKPRRSAQSDAYEQAMLLLMIVMYNPLCFNYSYVWLVYPLTCAFWIVFQEPSSCAGKERRCSFGVCCRLSILPWPFHFSEVPQAYGNAFFAGLIVLLGLAWQIRRVTAASESSAVSLPHLSLNDQRERTQPGVTRDRLN